MARAKKTKMEAVAEPKTKPVRLDLSPRSHKLLRIVASHSDQSMAAFARDALEQVLEERAKALGVKV